MLQQFASEITQLLDKTELLELENMNLKSRISELEENSVNNEEIVLLNAEINTLKAENTSLKEEKEELVNQISVLKTQADINLNKVAIIVKELKELISDDQ